MKEQRSTDHLKTEISSVPGLHLLAVRVSHAGQEETALVGTMHEVVEAATEMRKRLTEHEAES